MMSNTSPILHFDTCIYLESLIPDRPLHMIPKTVLLVVLSPLFAMAGLLVPLPAPKLDSPNAVFLFLVCPLEAFIGLLFFASLVTRFLPDVIRISHAIEGLLVGTAVMTLINAIVSYWWLFPVPMFTLSMGSGESNGRRGRDLCVGWLGKQGDKGFPPLAFFSRILDPNAYSHPSLSCSFGIIVLRLHLWTFDSSLSLFSGAFHLLHQGNVIFLALHGHWGGMDGRLQCD